MKFEQVLPLLKEGKPFRAHPYLQIKNSDGTHAMWVLSIGDVFAEDWGVIRSSHLKFNYSERKSNYERGKKLDRNIELFLDPEGKFKL
ncbi:Thoeris anti-defense Tad2 family protein [Vagococcus vulneris]|uniref:Thoeris anti-defense 2-like domain-containing protein n=1 Tax=Vagococcus vulneris TaxID=1977869 RepID=A0A429ZTE5_9ENTE|nr:MW1434 family type I TA system toxin [Vagococcus vulneris]RST96956.1 hypothetical protein CBF37_10390 [Vagococcus vulneris]